MARRSALLHVDVAPWSWRWRCVDATRRSGMQQGGHVGEGDVIRCGGLALMTDGRYPVLDPSTFPPNSVAKL